MNNSFTSTLTAQILRSKLSTGRAQARPEVQRGFAEDDVARTSRPRCSSPSCT